MIKLRAEQWAMVGVVGIGAFAAYLLTRARPREQPIDFNFAPRQPLTPAMQPGTLAQSILQPGPPGQPSHALLRRGDNVLGRLELEGETSASLSRSALGPYTAPFVASDRAGDDATALRNLQLAGFSNVRLFSRADIAADPGLVPLPDALTNVGAGSRWFWGTWNGNGTALAGDIVMPREVVLLWPTTTTPPPRMAFASP